MPHPIALLPARLTPLPDKAARQLRQRLPFDRPADGTIRWLTHGLDSAVAARRAKWAQPAGRWRAPWIAARGFRERVDRVGGMVTLTATAAALRETAVDVYLLGDYTYHGMDYLDVDWPHGEVQVSCDYRTRVSAARVARGEVLSEHPGCRDPAEVNPLIWERGAAVRDRRRPRAGAPAGPQRSV